MCLGENLGKGAESEGGGEGETVRMREGRNEKREERAVWRGEREATAEKNAAWNLSRSCRDLPLSSVFLAVSRLFGAVFLLSSEGGKQ